MQKKMRRKYIESASKVHRKCIGSAKGDGKNKVFKSWIISFAKRQKNRLTMENSRGIDAIDVTTQGKDIYF